MRVEGRGLRAEGLGWRWAVPVKNRWAIAVLPLCCGVFSSPWVQSLGVRSEGQGLGVRGQRLRVVGCGVFSSLWI